MIKPYIDEDLDEMKRVYDGLDDFLSEVANEISTTIPNEITTSLNVIYYPQLGYLIAIPLKLEWKDEKDFEFDGLYFQFNTSTTVYYKNDRMKGDIHGLIVDKEIEIIQKLQDRILQYVNLLLNASVLCSELDWHPLQELCVEVFVANDTFIEGGHGTLIDDDYQDTTMTNMNTNGLYESSKSNNNSVILLSGANFSGKSVYLKQVALITYMAHIGSFVPAESAIIGLTDKIFTRIQTRETISKIQSAFMIDLQQVSFALRNSTSKSLLIIDEFGKGTGSTAGLFCGVIEHLLKRGHNCPKVIAATHFHEIFENDLLSASLPITLATMEIFKDDRDEELTFLYRLVQGRSTSSWGTFCAAISGVPLHVVERAKYLSQLFSRYESIPPPFGDHIEQRSYTKYEQVARKFLQLDLKHPEAHSFANAAEEFEDKEQYAKAMEAHFRAAEQFLNATNLTSDPEAVRTLKKLYSNHNRQAKDLQPEVFNSQGNNNKNTFKIVNNVAIATTTPSSNNSRNTGATIIKGRIGSQTNNDTLEVPNGIGRTIDSSLNIAESTMTTTSSGSEKTIEESYMVLKGNNDSTDDDDSDPFNKFWGIVESLVQKISNPVAFATVPLNGTDSATQFDSNVMPSTLPFHNESKAEELSAAMMESFFVIPKDQRSGPGLHSHLKSRTQLSSASI
ncbi:5140_t:CDS:10 [Entrophospora sp. SA101]|nr:5140_t:CDS:10 [Entrophospora sp. SA101]